MWFGFQSTESKSAADLNIFQRGRGVEETKGVEMNIFEIFLIYSGCVNVVIKQKYKNTKNCVSFFFFPFYQFLLFQYIFFPFFEFFQNRGGLNCNSPSIRLC